ncbi:MAG: glycosyltransferase family 2 protein [Spirochaetaceae bacterium]|nr:glycosyltransferase family 2 protein [Spirochaetaceae bacterium]
MQHPLISIIIPNYNSEKVLQETLNSVLNQTYKNWELIFVDDCSTDKSLDIAKKNAKLDNRIKIFTFAQNGGPGIATKFGFTKSRGEWIAFIDADDIWPSNKLEKQMKFSLDNHYEFTCTDYEQVDENTKSLNRIIKANKKANYRKVIMYCPIGSSSVLIKASLLAKVDIPETRKDNDYSLWLRVLRIYPYIYGMQEVLMKYRIWTQSISYNKFNKIKYHWYVYREYENKAVIISSFLVIWWGLIKILKIK